MLVPRLGLRAAILFARRPRGGPLARSRRCGVRRVAAPRRRTGCRLLAAFFAPAWPRKSSRPASDSLRQLQDRVGLARRGEPSWTCSSTRTASRRRSPWTARTGTSITARTERPTRRRIPGHGRAGPHRADRDDAAPRPEGRFVLGLGTGVSAAAVARHPVRSIDIVDIEPSGVAAARLFEGEPKVLAEPRVRYIAADGRNVLLARRKTYDVIISDPSDIWVAGVGNLFTQDSTRPRARG